MPPRSVSAPWPLLLALIGALGIAACGSSGGSGGGGASVVPRGSRTLGLDFLNTTPASDFSNNMTLASAAGAEVMQLHMMWNGFETGSPSGCTATLQDPAGTLAAFDGLLPGAGMQMNLGILPITTTVSGMPADLPMFGDPSFDLTNSVCRFNAVLDFVHTNLSHVTLKSLALGNEIDAFAGSDLVDFWIDYGDFYTAVGTHARGLWSGVPVTINGTFAGVNGTSSNAIADDAYQAIHAASDMIGVNYYPIDASFHVKSPSVVATDIAHLLAHYPGEDFYFQEAGYQSGSVFTGSSPSLQAQFITAMFKAWDAHAARIPYIAFLRLNDVSHSDASTTATNYGLPGDTAFIEYIETLGLRDYAGNDKLAFTRLKAETQARGW